MSGPGTVVGIATGRSGDRMQVGVRFSAPVQTGPETQPLLKWVPALSRRKVRLVRDADPSPLLVPRSKIE